MRRAKAVQHWQVYQRAHCCATSYREGLFRILVSTDNHLVMVGPACLLRQQSGLSKHASCRRTQTLMKFQAYNSVLTYLQKFDVTAPCMHGDPMGVEPAISVFKSTPTLIAAAPAVACLDGGLR